MGMIASPENVEFRELVSSYAGFSPLTIAQKIGCDVKKVYDAQRYIKDHTKAPECIKERSQFKRKILDRAIDSNKFLVAKGGTKLQKYDVHGNLQPCGIETVQRFLVLFLNCQLMTDYILSDEVVELRKKRLDAWIRYKRATITVIKNKWWVEFEFYSRKLKALAEI